MAPTGIGYMHHPSICGGQVVFVCEDDLWLVAAGGGVARRLTSGLADATWPRLSPEGDRIAFVGREEGPADVYVVPVAGGLARRLTFQSSVRQVAGWTPDGSGVLYAASGPFTFELWLSRVDAGGGLPSLLPLGPAAAIAHGPRGGVALGRVGIRDPAYWKRYRGGGMCSIWIDEEGGGDFRRLEGLEGNLTSPCWLGDRLYFLSDHEGHANVYSCAPGGDDVRRHSDHADFFARYLSSDGRRLVYQAGADLHLLEPGEDRPRKLDVELASSRTQRRRRFLPADRYLDSAELSPDGSRLAITSRGKAFTFATLGGGVSRHGVADGVRYRLLSWLNDGRRLVAVASGDEADGERMVLLPADGSESTRRLDLDLGRAERLEVSPVGDRVAVANHRHELLLVDLEGGDARLRALDRSAHGPLQGLAWSPDGRWLAYGCQDTRETCAIKLCEVATGATTFATRPVLWDRDPAFDPAGRYLYFIGRSWRDAVYDEVHFDVDLPRACRPHAICLRREAPSPFEPGTGAPGPGGPGPVAAPGVEIDLEGIEDRVVAFPLPEGRYARLQGVENGAVFIFGPIVGTRLRRFRDRPWWTGALERYDLGSGGVERLAEAVDDVRVGRDGRTLLCRAANRLRVLGAGRRPPESGGDGPGPRTGWVDLERVRVPVEPAAEWRQMFREAWRLLREDFWSEDLSGVDWDGAYLRYLPLLERVATRSELSDLLQELFGELGTSHVYEFEGDFRRGPDHGQGYLGVDWDFDPAACVYRAGRIVRGDPWDPAATSPLLGPGVGVRPGDEVLAINGQALDASVTPPELLVDQAGRQVSLTVRRPGERPRQVTVRALADERPARYRDWAESNRRAVHQATNGRVGYVHLPELFASGFAVFHRGFLVEYDRDALIVDVRGNGGGHVSTLVLDKLARRRVAYGVRRRGEPQPFPPHSPAGPLVCLTNGFSGSDGDVFSQAFRLLGLGPLVGGRSWGGVTGIAYVAHHRLVDETVITRPEFCFHFDDTGWGTENRGAVPDFEVENAPQDYAAGADRQLERAVEVALERLRRFPPHRPRPGQRPVLSPPPLPPRRPARPPGGAGGGAGSTGR